MADGDGRVKITVTADMLQALEQTRKLKRETARMAEVMGATRTEVRQVKRALDKEAKAAAVAAEASRRAAADTTAFTSALGKVSPAAASASSALSGVASKLGVTGVAAAAAAAAVVGVGVAAVAVANKMSVYVDKIGLLSEGTGLATSTVVALDHALAGGGSKIEAVQGALGEFVRRMKSVEGETRSADQILRDTLKTIAAIEDPTERAAARLQAFGTEAGKAFAAVDAQALERSITLTAELADAVDASAGASKRWDQALADLSTQMDTFTVNTGRNFGEAILALTDLLGSPTDKDTFIGALAEAASYVPTLAFAFGSNETQQAWADWATGVGAAEAKTKALREELEKLAPKVGVAGQSSVDEWRQVWEATPSSAAASKGSATGGRGSRAPKVDRGAAAAARTDAGLLRDQASEEANARRDQIAEGIALAAEQAEQEQAIADAAEQARQDRVSRELADLEELKEARMSAANAGIAAVGSLAAAAGASAEQIAAAKLLETVAYQAVAVGRAFAEGGPFAGPIAAANAVAAIAPQIASLTKAMGGGGGDGGSSESSSGGGPTRRQRRRDRRDTGGGSFMIQIDNRTYEAEASRSRRYDRLNGNRRGKAQSVGS